MKKFEKCYSVVLGLDEISFSSRPKTISRRPRSTGYYRSRAGRFLVGPQKKQIAADFVLGLDDFSLGRDFVLGLDDFSPPV